MTKTLADGVIMLNTSTNMFHLYTEIIDKNVPLIVSLSIGLMIIVIVTITSILLGVARRRRIYALIETRY